LEGTGRATGKLCVVLNELPEGFLCGQQQVIVLNIGASSTKQPEFYRWKAPGKARVHCVTAPCL